MTLPQFLPPTPTDRGALRRSLSAWLRHRIAAIVDRRPGATTAELASAVGLTRSPTDRHLRHLLAAGDLTRVPGQHGWRHYARGAETPAPTRTAAFRGRQDANARRGEATRTLVAQALRDGHRTPDEIAVVIGMTPRQIRNQLHTLAQQQRARRDAEAREWLPVPSPSE